MIKKTMALITLTCLFLTAIPFGVFAAEETDTGTQVARADLKDDLVTTKHTAVINGKNLSYTATAGTMVLESGGELCEMFFIGYQYCFRKYIP